MGCGKTHGPHQPCQQHGAAMCCFLHLLGTQGTPGGRCSPLPREPLPSVLAAWKAPEPMTQDQHSHAALVSASPAPRAGEGVVFPPNTVSRAGHSWLSLKAVLEVDLAGSLFTLSFTEKAVGCSCPGRSLWHSLGKQDMLANNSVPGDACATY